MSLVNSHSSVDVRRHTCSHWLVSDLHIITINATSINIIVKGIIGHSGRA